MQRAAAPRRCAAARRREAAGSRAERPRRAAAVGWGRRTNRGGGGGGDDPGTGGADALVRALAAGVLATSVALGAAVGPPPEAQARARARLEGSAGAPTPAQERSPARPVAHVAASARGLHWLGTNFVGSAGASSAAGAPAAVAGNSGRGGGDRGSAMPNFALLQTEDRAEPLNLALSANAEVRGVQRTMVEAWALAHDAFFDASLTGQAWGSALEGAMRRAAHASTASEAHAVLDGMMASLGDRYSRVLVAPDAEAFMSRGKKNLEGVGVVVRTNARQDAAIVLAPVEGGPAAAAGIKAGDIITAVDGTPVNELTAQGVDVATKLRGEAGTAVRLTVDTPRDAGVGGVVSRDAVGAGGSIRAGGVAHARPNARPRELSLRRRRVRMREVVSRAVFVPKVSAPRTAAHRHRHKLGYIRLSTFGESAAAEMSAAIERLSARGCDHFVLDLRSNSGGLVTAGLQTAALWLDGETTVAAVYGRGGSAQRVDTPRQMVAATHAPLAVLVNKGSASATEIATAALQDNERAVVVGERTYGKGRIQEVFDLSAGSKLFLTVATYKSPVHFHPIDGVGVAPDIKCTVTPRETLPAAAARAAALAPPTMDHIARAMRGGENGTARKLTRGTGLAAEVLADSCVLKAEETLVGKMDAETAGVTSSRDV